MPQTSPDDVAGAAAPVAVDVYRPARPLDLVHTLVPLRHGGGDPVWRWTRDGAVWWATRTADGPATLRLEPRSGAVHAAAWGPGAERVVAGVPALLGADDDDSTFPAHLHPLVDRAHRALPGLRIGRTGQVWEQLVPAVLEQRVVGLDAQASWRVLVRRHGTPAPGPAPEGLTVAPPASVWRDLPVWVWRRAGVDAQRHGTVVRAAAVAHALGADLGATELTRRLRTVPGIGPWTAAEVTSRALGDVDAVSVGDLHLPNLVGWSLAGRRTDDAGMLELLEPFRPQRLRAVRLLEVAGSRPPARGPRAPRARALV
ncbi:DNA-3-methyladenine glycosylase 2 family protein [Cellulomonas sp. 73-145]|uniref:DNA-3-methyladenine glycosylase family protein n=1 Tax=Cellulomonas sp. 73-145 TaxID=1895739 RepID=UPI000A485355|nr:DNA-3-methyladenine glycosylase 2 family protein [Cellulomonas sp. 73-145]